MVADMRASDDGLTVMLAGPVGDISRVLAFVERANSGKKVFQAFDYEAVVSREHLIAAYESTLMSFRSGSNVASRPYIEMLLFAAMTRQIGDAIVRMGVRDSRRFAVFSNDANAVRGFSKMAVLSEFGCTARHSRDAARRLGLERTGYADMLSRMALSRLG